MLGIRDPITKSQNEPQFQGTAGIMVASHGNEVLGQMPTLYHILCFYGYK
jgi:hypothetical protein